MNFLPEAALTEEESVNIIKDFVNYTEDSPEFPINSIAIGPSNVMLALETLERNTIEDESDRFTPYFTGFVKKILTKLLSKV